MIWCYILPITNFGNDFVRRFLPRKHSKVTLLLDGLNSETNKTEPKPVSPTLFDWGGRLEI
jgi:hypothetical protein